MKALIVPFVKYNYSDHQIDRVLMDYLLLNVHRIPVDCIIFCVSKFDIATHNTVINGKQIRFVNSGDVWHQSNIEAGIATLQAGDKFVVMDNDCLIYDYSIFDDMFNDLDTHDIVCNLDSGTRIVPTHVKFRDSHLADLSDPINLMYRIPIMYPTAERGVRTRFAATLFGCTYDFYTKHNCDVHNSSAESMETFSRNVATLTPNVRVKELLDFRNGIIVDGIGKLLTQDMSDDSRTDELRFGVSKYYHIRNFGETVRMVDPLNTSQPAISQNISEGLRLISWFTTIAQKVFKFQSNYSICIDSVESLLEKHNVPNRLYQSHLSLTARYHRTHLL